jgi:hypothetical protein
MTTLCVHFTVRLVDGVIITNSSPLFELQNGVEFIFRVECEVLCWSVGRWMRGVKVG